MLKFLARCALRLSSIAIPLVALAFVTGSPTPAKADICSPFLTSTFPGPGVSNGLTINQCTTDIVIGAGGSVTILHNNTPYTNSGNALIGVVNNSGSSVFDLFITGFGPANGSPGNTGDVIFTGNLLPGQSAIFGTLQDILNAAISLRFRSLALPRYSAPAFSALPSIASACGDTVVSPRG